MTKNDFFIRAIGLSILSFVFLFFLATVSSPINDFTGGDYGIFRCMGQITLDGGIIFRDLFDNKGPYVFFLQTLGLWISPGKWGIFIIEVIFLAVSLEVLYRIGKVLKLTVQQNFWSILVFLLYLSLIFCEGDKSEELSLPFLCLSLLFGLKTLQTTSTKSYIIYSGIMGISMSIIMLMKLTNACLLVGEIIGICIIFIKDHKFKTLTLCAFGFLSGIIVGFLPALIYFSINGALYDMLYATFLYNFKYRHGWIEITTRNHIINTFRLGMCVTAPILAWLYDRRHHTQWFLPILCMAILPPLIFIDSPSYLYYFISISPLVYLSIAFSVRYRKTIQAFILAFIFLPPFLIRDWYFENRLVDIVLSRDYTLPRSEEIFQKWGNPIPQAELDSVYIMEVLGEYSDILQQLGHSPVGKYFTHQYNTSRVDDEARADIIETFKKSNPKWIISGPKPEDSMFADCCKDRYILIDSMNVYFPKGNKDIPLLILRRKTD